MPKATSPDPILGTKTIRAAGAVVWRPGPRDETPEIAIIHRPRYDDWSLPKGKVDPGENEPVAAAREIEEETGFRARLGRQLATVHYSVPQGAKQVRYWAARHLHGEFRANDEVDELKWLPAPQAMSELQYPHDRDVVSRFLAAPADTRSVLIVRHATAGSKSRFVGDDRLRPLDKHGRAQAESLISQLLAFGAEELFAADRVRCQQTLDPLAEELGATIRAETSLTEEAYKSDRDAAHERILDIAASSATPVICSQGKVIPGLVDWWCRRDGVRPGQAGNRKGSTWVMSLVDGRLIAADHIDTALPPKK